MTLTLMTLTTLSPKQPDSIVNRKSHYPSKNDKKGRIVFFQRKKEKNALKSKKKWFRWHFSPLQKAKIRGGKRLNEGGKTRNFLIYFAKILIKRAKNWDRAKRNMYGFSCTKHGTLQKHCANYSTDCHYLTNKHHPFRITFRSLIRSLRTRSLSVIKDFRGRRKWCIV